MRKKYLASIITPFYNEPLWMLQRNISSVMNQKLPAGAKIQHIVVIDKSKEEYEKMFDIKFFLENLEIPSRCSYDLMFFHLDKNRGLPSARNAALKVAQGSFIFLLDTDDSMAYEDRIGEQILFMLDNKLSHSYGGYSEIHGNSSEPSKDIIMPNADMEGALKSMVNPCYCGSNCFKAEVVSAIGGFDASMLDGAEDMEYWVRIAKHPDLQSGCLEKVTYFLGVHGDNMTARYVAEKRFEKAFKYMKEKHQDFFIK